YRTGPFGQDVASVAEPSGRQAQPAKRNERVSSPVRKPWIARHDCPARTTCHKIRIGRPIESRREALATTPLGVTHVGSPLQHIATGVLLEHFVNGSLE